MIPYPCSGKWFAMFVTKELFPAFVEDCFSGKTKIKYFYLDSFDTPEKVLANKGDADWKRYFFGEGNQGYICFHKNEDDGRWYVSCCLVPYIGCEIKVYKENGKSGRDF